MSKSPEILERFEKSPNKVKIPVKQAKCLTPLSSKNKSFLSSSSFSSINNKTFITNSNIPIGYNALTGFRKHQSISSQIDSIISINSLLLSFNSIVNKKDNNIRLISSINNTESLCDTYSTINGALSYYMYKSKKKIVPNKIFDENYNTSCQENSKYLEEMIINEQKYMTTYTKKYYVPKISCQVNVRSISRLRNEKMKIQLAKTPKKKVIADGDQYYVPYIKSKSKSKAQMKTLVTSYSTANKNKLTKNKTITKEEDKKKDLTKSDFFSYGFKGINFNNTLSKSKDKSISKKYNTIHRSNTENAYYIPQTYHHNTKTPNNMYMYSSGMSTNSSSTSQHAANKKRIEKLKELKTRLENMKDDDEYDAEDLDSEEDKHYCNTEIK